MTASKAIIEKEYQPKVIVSKQGPNPFTKLTDQELEEYRKEVEQKQKGTEGKGDEWRGEGEMNVSIMWKINILSFWYSVTDEMKFTTGKRSHFPTIVDLCNKF